jgi:hypothetical protein
MDQKDIFRQAQKYAFDYADNVPDVMFIQCLRQSPTWINLSKSFPNLPEMQPKY